MGEGRWQRWGQPPRQSQTKALARILISTDCPLDDRPTRLKSVVVLGCRDAVMQQDARFIECAGGQLGRLDGGGGLGRVWMQSVKSGFWLDAWAACLRDRLSLPFCRGVCGHAAFAACWYCPLAETCYPSFPDVQPAIAPKLSSLSPSSTPAHVQAQAQAQHHARRLWPARRPQRPIVPSSTQCCALDIHRLRRPHPLASPPRSARARLALPSPRCCHLSSIDTGSPPLTATPLPPQRRRPPARQTMGVVCS